jgi:asparagine synthase (glutamine-hydrolysing)
MCGIAGIIARNPTVVQAALPAMVSAQAHRGPDDSGELNLPFQSAKLGMGFRRLSILDLSQCGHQPMVHPTTGDCLIFNGEIYNFRELRGELEGEGVVFRGHSDTEVLLHALVQWGTAAIDRLAGMYAFAFYKAKEQRLLLARDPLGIKPLYTASVKDAFLFASEVRSLLASQLIPRKSDPRAVACFLAYGSGQAPHTMLQRIELFPPGYWQEIDVKVLDHRAEPPHCYWDVPPPQPAADIVEVCRDIRAKLNQAVREHLESDVPVGVFLSGGLDSTIIARLATKYTDRLRTFTIGFADNPDLSESTVAAETARLIGAEHHDIQIVGDRTEQICIEWLESLDRPSIDGLNTFIISQAVRAQGIVVALSGLGGDELFAGYSTFWRIPRLLRALHAIRWAPSSVRSMLATASTLGRPAAVAEKAVDMATSDGSLLELELLARRVMSNQQLVELGIDGHALGLTKDLMSPPLMDSLRIDPDDPVWTISLLESRIYMSNTLLRDTDTNGMAHGLEIRVPFLDRRVIDYVFSLPGGVRLPTASSPKYLLKRTFSEMLRPDVTNRRKSGFTLPIGQWMAGPLRGMCEEAVEHLKSHGGLRSEGVDRIWNDFIRNKKRSHWSRAFALCVLGQYLRRHKIT